MPKPVGQDWFNQTSGSTLCHKLELETPDLYKGQSRLLNMHRIFIKVSLKGNAASKMLMLKHKTHDSMNRFNVISTTFTIH
jgi:hypothetical protein